MANPLPGMDPYLEGNLWPVVHANLASEISRQINPKLRPRYAAVTTQRVVIAAPDDDVARSRWPDLGVVSDRPPPAQGGDALLDAPFEANSAEDVETPTYAVEILDPDGHRPVTAVEILSPTNKQGHGGNEYAAQRRELLAGPAHLVEIDLLREGTRFALDRPPPPAPYYVFVSQVERRPKVRVWPIALASPLPPIPIPLDLSVPPVTLELQVALDTIHELMNYDMLVNYRQPPPGPLSADDLAWVDERLRAAGKRP
jgi:hypothetical protein